MRLSIVSILILVFAFEPSRANEEGASKVQAPETITVLGKTFQIVPFQLEDTSRTWAVVKPYLPLALAQEPKKSLTKQQILATINELLHDRGDRYDSDLKVLTDRHLKEFLKTTPQANWDWFNLSLAGDCLANKPGPYLPESTVRMCQQYTALLYLQEMLSKTNAQSAPNSAATVQAENTPVVTQPTGPSLKPLSSFRDCDRCPEMVVIPAGSYLMGASPQDRRIADPYTIESELPQHRVTIGYAFAIGRFDVTVKEFAAFVQDTGIKTGGECLLRTPDSGPHRGQFIGTPKPGAPVTPGLATVIDANFGSPGQHVSDDDPATCISRREALQYLQWLGKQSGRRYRFPTEAEWEYATRAGTTTPYFFSGPVGNLCKYANFADRRSPYGAGMAAPCAENPSPAGFAPVGSYRPNPWSLYDTIGNVFEFIEDCRFPNYRGAPIDGSPWRQQGAATCPEGFVTRGYYFDSIYTDMRSAARCTAGDTWDERENFLGLRVAVSLDDRAWDARH